MKKKLLTETEKFNFCKSRDRMNRKFDDELEPIFKKRKEYEHKIELLNKKIDKVNQKRADWHNQHKKNYGFDLHEKMW